ncbi:MAG TPA: DUF3592 domain-containing protein [Mycobacteriales bacterium]|nr:DUF3592 domain-containing protein [Mycobacteriales bacterium]
MFRGLYNRRKPKPLPAIAWLSFGLLVLFLGIEAMRSGRHNEQWLTAHGTRTDARLTSLSCNGQPTTRLSLAYGRCSVLGTFTFHTESGKDASTRMYLSGQPNLHVGDTVLIEYNPGNPANAQLANSHGTRSNSAAEIGLVLVIAAAPFLIGGTVKSIRSIRNRRFGHEPEAGEAPANA